MRKIKILLVILGFISSFAFGQGLPPLPYGYGGFKPGSEPDGFRGIKWGTDIRTLPGMKYFRTGEDKDIQIYVRENDELKIGGAILERIEYCFWRGKFCDVLIYTKGFVNFDSLKEAVFEKFGEGFKSKSDKYEIYIWGGTNTGMLLEYSEVSGTGLLCISSRKIAQQMEEYRKQKAKEGAEKGF